MRIKKKTLVELFKKGSEFGCVIPAGTEVAELEQALALLIIDTSKFRGISTATTIAEVTQWVEQLKENL